MFPRVVVFDLDGTWWRPDMYELWGGGGAPFKRIPNTDSAMLDKGRNTVELLDGTMRIVSELWHWSQHHQVPAPTSSGASPSSTTSSKKRAFNQPPPFVVAAASTCDEPRWAKELLDLFHTRPFPYDKQVLIGDSTHTRGNHKNTKGDEIHLSSDREGNTDGGIVTFATVLGDLDEIYKGNKRTHMANILQKLKQSKAGFSPCVASSAQSPLVSPNNGPNETSQIFIPPLFAAALPAGCSVCQTTGLVTFTNPSTEAALRQQLIEEDQAPLSYKDFIFFDNQTNNIHDVSKAGITSAYVPEGMTLANWAKGLQQWRREQRQTK